MAPERQEKRISATLEEARSARAWLRGRLGALSAEDRAIVPDMLLVFGELVTNSVRHAYGPGEAGVVDITITISDGWVELGIQDYGTPMDRSAYKPPDLSEAHEGGYGIHLIRQLTDELSIESPGGRGNRFTARRRLSSNTKRPAMTPGAG